MSSSNSAFNLQGAVKKPAFDFGGSLSSLTNTPMTNALNSMQIGGQTTPKIAMPSAPSNQIVTSHTVKPDGTVKQTYANSSGTTPTSKPKTSGVMQNTNTQQNANAGSLPNVNPNAAMQEVTGGSVGTPMPPQTPAPAPNSYPGLIGTLAKTSQDTGSLDRAAADLENLRKGYATAVGNIESTPIPLEFQQGRTQVLGRQFASQEAAASQRVANELAARGQTISGLGTAAGLAAPIQAPYSNQVLDPTTGQPIGGGAPSGNLQSAVSDIAQKVQSGLMGYDDGVKALSAYGQGGVNALQTALGSNFDVVGSNARAAARTASDIQTGTIGGELQKGAETVKEHMITLQDAYEKLKAQYGIPLINAGINAIASQFGNGALQSYNIALQNVRDELAKILGGGTSTDGSRATAHALLPDNMTPAQLTASVKTATELMNSKIQEYTKTSTNPQNNGTNSNNIWSW